MITEIVFPGWVPGMNGKDGLIRMHHTKKTALRNAYFYEIRSTTTNQHKGPVRLELVRHSIGREMDYDGLVSTGKLLIDALVNAKVLPDDNPGIIAQREYTQTKAINQKSQMTVIRIIDIPWEEIVEDLRYEEGPECEDGFPITTFCG